ncbi:uncharacterized protein [Epargyreus clarus]|uniref:uncharacterized protein n=1 Tax=Epargyreus clarus TaxID=520877 RepID=UPI003C2B93C5
MYHLVNANFSRTYNPNSRQNALCDIKRLLTSRDTAAQNKACGYLIEVINRYKLNSNERTCMIEYLLQNDITVFLCEATSNLDFSLFRTVLSCIRLLWRSRGFFAEEHAAHAMAAVVRTLAHYSATGSHAAVDACLHFICDLLNGISLHGTTSPLSLQSAYSTEQLLACLNALVPRINTNPNTVLRSALVLSALVSYQPPNLAIRSSTAKCLIEVLKQWFELLLAALNHVVLVGDSEHFGMFLVVMCQIGMDSLRLIKLLNYGNQPADFVQSICVDIQEINSLKQCASEIGETIQRVMCDLITFVKDNQNQINSEEYTIFLKLLLHFIYDTTQTEASMNFCDLLFSKGYLTMLPQNQISRGDGMIRKVSTLVLGEMLKALAEKYLFSNNVNDENNKICTIDNKLDLVELQYGIEKPESTGLLLQKSQPYSLLIYIYFYCQSSENPEEATAPLLPFLVQHILRLPKFFKPPPHIVKALWLVFAMSTISNGSIESLDERVYLEKATDRLVTLLQPDPSVYYTHNPAILFWAFTSLRIPNHVRIQVLSQWLMTEDALPEDLIKEPLVWELLLNVLIQNRDDSILINCREALNICIEEGDDNAKQDFALLVWSMLPEVLSKTLIDCESEIGSNICYLLDMATILQPQEVNTSTCLKIGVLITTMFSKNSERPGYLDTKYHYEYVCLKLCLLLLGLSNNQNDQRVLLTYINRVGFLPSVLTASNSTDDRVACAALQLLSYVVHYFTRNKYQPKAVLEIQTDLVIKSLRRDSTNERGSSLLQLVYMTLNSMNSPLVLTQSMSVASDTRQSDALRALMFRIQTMLCCRDSENQSSAGWKTLSSIFKHAIVSKNDPRLVATLTSQPWTYTLIRFQLTQNITQEFLSFTQSWLTLLKITIKKGHEGNKSLLSKYSLITRTLVMIKKNLVIDEELKEMQENVQQIVKEILEEFCVKT